MMPAAMSAAVEQTISSEIRRYTDPVTEFPVFRLTSPSSSAWLPAWNQSATVRRGHTLLYVSDRGGSLQAWRMDTRSGESKRLTEAQALDRGSVTLTPDQHSICFVDGRSVGIHPLSGGRERVAYRVPDTHHPAGGFSVAHDGSFCTLAEQVGGRHRLRLIRFAGNTALTLFEKEQAFRDVMPRPGGTALLYRSDEGLWLAPLEGHAPVKLNTASGEIGPAYWSVDGRTLLYLQLESPGTIRQLNPETGQDTVVARTSRFVSFSPNSDQTVFAGASGSKVSPCMLVLVRSVRRELTLCEHRSSHPEMADPVFSPDSQQVFFVSDREGRPAIYSMRLEHLLEKTEE
jgi:oligogalacturonide lyase